MTIAIVGATGMLGGEVTRRLVASGHHVVAITRSAQRAAPLAALGVDVRVADLTDRASLEAALVGVTAVFAAAHSLLGRGRYSSSMVDGSGHRALIDVARARGVARFVYTSVLGALPGHPAPFWRTKFEVEAIYDNSEKNPLNPFTPPQAVYFGEQTTNEMCFVFLGATSEQPGRIIARPLLLR